MTRKGFETNQPPIETTETGGLSGKVTRELIELYIRQTCRRDHLGLKEAIDRLERDVIVDVLERTNGNQREAAEILGLKPTTLFYKLRRMGIMPVRKYTWADIDGRG